ncbi:MAG: NADH-quinone oxidoreductase subunit NuoB [Thermoguttaceae bacterium]
MLRIALARLNQGHRTVAYPAQPPTLPERFRGLPVIDRGQCRDGCRECADVCPTHAIALTGSGPRLDLGRCLFCTDCTEACPTRAIRFTPDHRLATRQRDDLLVDGRTLKLAEALEEKSRQLFGRSLKLRQVSAAGCNACEADLNVLGTVVFDMGRFGIQFVASPRHADGIVVTGPVSENMRTALLDTYAAVPAPKLVIAVGACAISGGPYVDNAEVHNGCTALVPVDLFIPGCPPHPITILDGLLRLLGRLKNELRPGKP